MAGMRRVQQPYVVVYGHRFPLVSGVDPRVRVRVRRRCPVVDVVQHGAFTALLADIVVVVLVLRAERVGRGCSPAMG